MKNYKVKALRNFTDGLEKINREKNDIFECDKERYEFLKSKGAVELIEVQESIKKEPKEFEGYTEIIEEKPQEEKKDKVVEEIITKKKKSNKK